MCAKYSLPLKVFGWNCHITWSQGNLHYIRLHFLKVDREFFCLQPSLARLYSTAASPSERLRSDGSLAISHGNVFLPNFNLKNRIVSQGLLDLKQRTIPVGKKIRICKCIRQGWSNSLETSGGGRGGLGSSLYLESRGFGVRRTHWTSLCILKPENVSPSCRDIIVSMLWIFIFNFYSCMFWLFGEKYWGEGGKGPRHLLMLRPCKHIEKIKGWGQIKVYLLLV